MLGRLRWALPQETGQEEVELEAVGAVIGKMATGELASEAETVHFLGQVFRKFLLLVLISVLGIKALRSLCPPRGGEGAGGFTDPGSLAPLKVSPERTPVPRQLPGKSPGPFPAG